MLIVKLFRQHSKRNFSTLKGHLWSMNTSWWSVLPLLPAVCNLAAHVPVCTVLRRLYTPLLSRDVNTGTWMCLEIPKEIITKGRQGDRGHMRKCQEHHWGPASLVFLPLLTHSRHSPVSGRCVCTVPLLGMFDSYFPPWLTLLHSSSLCPHSLTNQFATPLLNSWHFLTPSLL